MSWHRIYCLNCICIRNIRGDTCYYLGRVIDTLIYLFVISKIYRYKSFEQRGISYFEIYHKDQYSEILVQHLKIDALFSRAKKHLLITEIA